MLEMFFWGGGHSISGEEAVRDERRCWQGVCSLLLSPEILDLVHLHPALTLKEGGAVDIFSRAVLQGWIFPFPVPKLGLALPLPPPRYSSGAANSDGQTLTAGI